MYIFLYLLLLTLVTNEANLFGSKKTGIDDDEHDNVSPPCPATTYPTKNLHTRSDINNNELKKYQKDYDHHQSHCDCAISEFGIKQKIPYHDQTTNPIDIQFSSACVRCGLCLVIADKINKTLMGVHDVMSPDQRLNESGANDLFKMICDQSFLRYRLREIDKERYIGDSLPGSIIVESTANGLWATNLKIKCNELLDGITPTKLYKQWQEYYENNKNKNLATILCNGDIGILRDCRSIADITNYQKAKNEESFYAGVKIKAAFNCFQ